MARYENGWIKLSRRTVIEDIGDNVFALGLWVMLLSLANWKETKIIWEGKQRILPPGTIVFGYRELAERWDCSKTTVKKWAKYLEDTKRIQLDACPRGCIATICNWERYQTTGEGDSPQGAHSAPTASPQRAHSESFNEEVQQGKKVRIDSQNVTVSEPEFALNKEDPLKRKQPNPLNAVTWEAYREVYKGRYGEDPIRNASVNAKISQLVKRLGEEAPEVAAFYVRHNKQFYVQNLHPIGMLLADCEGLRTQWATGRQVLSTTGREVERLQHNSDVWSQAALNLAKRKDGTNG